MAGISNTRSAWCCRTKDTADDKGVLLNSSRKYWCHSEAVLAVLTGCIDCIVLFLLVGDEAVFLAPLDSVFGNASFCNDLVVVALEASIGCVVKSEPTGLIALLVSVDSVSRISHKLNSRPNLEHESKRFFLINKISDISTQLEA